MDSHIRKEGVKTEEMFQKIKKFGALDKRFEMNEITYEMKVKGFRGIILWYLEVVFILLILFSIYLFTTKNIENVMYDVLFISVIVILTIIIHKIEENIVRRKLFFDTDYIEIQVVK